LTHMDVSIMSNMLKQTDAHPSNEPGLILDGEIPAQSGGNHQVSVKPACVCAERTAMHSDLLAKS
jgi:hypothetical protein